MDDPNVTIPEADDDELLEEEDPMPAEAAASFRRRREHKETETLASDGFFQYWDRSPANLQMGVIDYGTKQRLFYDFTSTVEKVMLIKFGSSTHSFNMGQLAAELDFELKPGKQIEVQMPGNPRTCPPGHYMMFFINDKGTPSQAALMEILNL